MPQSLALVPVEQRALAIRKILEEDGPEAAETSLMELADAQGDTTVATLVNEMRPIDLNQLFREFDLSKSTIAADFVSPAKAAEALKSEARFWNPDEKPESIQDHVVSYITSLVLSAEDEVRRGEMLKSIGGTPWGHLLLQLCFADRLEAIWYAKTGSFTIGQTEASTHSEIPVGEWKELMHVCDQLQPDLFESLMSKVVSHRESSAQEWFERGGSDPDEFDIAFGVAGDERFSTMIAIIDELREMAGEEEKVQGGGEDIFTPL